MAFPTTPAPTILTHTYQGLRVEGTVAWEDMDTGVTEATEEVMEEDTEGAMEDMEVMGDIIDRMDSNRYLSSQGDHEADFDYDHSLMRVLENRVL